MSLETLSAVFQKIPLVRGKTRLGRYLMRKYLPLRDVVIRSRYGQRFLVPHLAESVAYQILINGEHEPYTLKALRKLLPKGGNFIDIGANMGFFAVTLASDDPSARVIAVEGSPRIAQYTRKNIEMNGLRNVTLVHRAITNVDDQKLAFYEAPLGQFGRGSLSNTEWKDKTETLSRTLDMLVETENIRADVIKIDIEGSEAFAFEGGKKTLSAPDAPTLIFEFYDWAEEHTAGLKIGDAQKILHGYGYTVWRIRDWLGGRGPSPQIFTTGFEILVAQKVRK